MTNRWLLCLSSLLAVYVFCASGRAQKIDTTADPRRPAAIEADGVPVLPADLPARLARYQSVRGASFGGWAPSGKGILVRTRFGNTAQLHRVFVPGGRRKQVTFFKEPVRGSFIPQAPDDAILLTMSKGGNENYQIHLLEPGQHRSLRLTTSPHRFLLGAVRPDGKEMIYASNARNGRDMDLYRADARRPDSAKMIFPVDGEYWFAADWSQDAKTLLLGRYVSVTESYMALMDLKSGKRTGLSLPDDKQAAIGALALSPDDKSVYLATDVNGEFRELARLNLKTRKYQWLTGDVDWDVDGLAVDRDSQQVAFTVNEDGASRLYLLEEDQPKSLDVPLGIIDSLEFSPDGEHLGFSLARPDAPLDAYSIRLDTGELTRWTISEVGGLDPEKFVTPRRFRFRSFDDREIPAYLYQPAGASPENKVPVLINIHGGPESQYRPYFSGSTQYYVNEMGVAVIYPNVRGSRGYGKTYVRLDNAELREDSVKDIGALLDWIEKQPQLDASRVAVGGGSYGGYMVLASLVHFGDRLRAGIDVVGIANFITFLENTAPYRQDLRRVEYGDERDAKMRAVFERINPTNHADKIDSALLVAHGKNDPRVPFSEAEQIAAKVRNRGRPVWTVYAGNEGHGFGKKENRDYLRAVQVLFLERHLLGEREDSVEGE